MDKKKLNESIVLLKKVEESLSELSHSAKGFDALKLSRIMANVQEAIIFLEGKKSP